MNPDQRSGIVNAIAAYLMWGIIPIYFKLLNSVPSAEILVHRIVWSVALLLVLLIVLNKMKDFFRLWLQPKIIISLLVSSLLLAGNWLLYIYAVNSNQLLEASLGYYINPLFSVLLGFLVLGERFRLWQKVAIGLALVGVIFQIVAVGHVPLIALTLAGSFGIYGLMRKKIPVDSLTGLTIETALLTPIALVYWVFFANSEFANMANNDLNLNLLLIAAGIVTTAPLLCFNSAAKKIPLSTLGLLQYIGPSLMFLLAIFIYQEPLTPIQVVTFGFIWSALAVFSWDSIRHAKKKS